MAVHSISYVFPSLLPLHGPTYSSTHFCLCFSYPYCCVHAFYFFPSPLCLYCSRSSHTHFVLPHRTNAYGLQIVSSLFPRPPIHLGTLDNSGNDTASLLIALAVLPRVHVIRYCPRAGTHLLACLLQRDFLVFPTFHETEWTSA